MWSTPAPMRKVSLYMLDADAQKAAMTLARLAVMQPLENDQIDQALDDLPAASYQAVYHNLNSRFGKISALSQQVFDHPRDSAEVVTQQQLEELDAQLKSIWIQVSDIEEQLRRQNEKTSVNRQLSNSLQKFSSLDLDLGRLRRRGQFLRIVVGTVPSSNFDQLKRALSLTRFMIKSFYKGDGIEHVVIFGSAEQHEDVQELLKSADFRGLNIPEEFSASPAQLQSDMDRQFAQSERTVDALKRQLADLLSSKQAMLATTHELLVRARPYASLASVLKGRGGLVSIQGWVPVHCQQQVKQALETSLQFPFHIEFCDPAVEEFESVPSLLNKTWLLNPFQSLVKNFGTPGYREVDPSGLFAFSYILMFGMMFGDIGHGLVILLGSLLFYKRFPAVAIVGVLAGLSSIIFGFVYGSIFGYEEIVTALWMSPMHDPVRILLVAVAWGASFLIIANTLAIRNYLAIGQNQQAFYSGRGLAGMFLYLAAIYTGYQIFNGNAFGWLEAALMAFPMLAILQFQWSQSSGGIVERVLVVFIEGLEHVISNVSGTLSFLRVAAFSLNHIALAAAVFAIAGMLDVFGHWLTVVLGNIFIIVLEGAIVAIQCLRLEYYEGFSRFFSGKGKAFEPLKIET